MRPIRLAILLSAVLIACDGDEIVTAPLEQQSFKITTDSLSYESVSPLSPGEPYRNWGFRLITTLKNTGAGTLFLTNCIGEPIIGIGPVIATGGQGYGQVAACTGAPPLHLNPGRSRTDTTWISGPKGFNQGGFPVDERDLDGEFMVAYSIDSCFPTDPCYAHFSIFWPTIQVHRQPDQ